MDYKEPLFWIHLNMDYPFNLKGILYFPKINMEYESIEGQIKLYNNQVFVADNIKAVSYTHLDVYKRQVLCAAFGRGKGGRICKADDRLFEQGKYDDHPSGGNHLRDGRDL